MIKKFEKTHLVVSGLGGNVYIADITKTPHVMSQTRKEVPESEFFSAIIDYLKVKFPETICQIRAGGKLEAELTLIWDEKNHERNYEMLKALKSGAHDSLTLTEFKELFQN